METPRLTQIVTYNLATQVGEPTGFIGLDDRGRIWRGVLDPAGRAAAMVLREVNVIFEQP
jgi:hypothetical protein